PHRRDAEWRLREPDRVDELDDSRRPQQRVLAARHRRRAGMALEAGQPDFVPALALAMGDDADIDRFVFEDGALFDMQLERGVDRPTADRLLALESDPLEFCA